MKQLLQVMEQLRNPETGCPWDIEQTFETILPHTIEEAYEVADAIERKSISDLKEELGDLLFQVVFYARIAEESEQFTFQDIVEHITTKMISRHPHVFGDKKAKSAADVNEIWEQQKEKETKQDSVLDGVAKALPALMRAQKLSKRAARSGFEFKNIDGACQKVFEELEELQETVREKESQTRIEEEFGDTLFALVQYGRLLNIDCENALRKANGKFTKRFQKVEEYLNDKKIPLKQANDNQWLEAWAFAKRSSC